MNLYFLYLILLNMLINVIIFVPNILISYRFEGAVMGVVIAIPIGLAVSILYSKAFSWFPGKGLPEILNQTQHPGWKAIILPGFSIFWFSAGFITMLGFIDILSRFVNPEIPKLLLSSIYIAGACFIARLPTNKVMYFLEIVLFLNVPLISFIIFTAFNSDSLNWDSMLEVGTHIFVRPSLKAVAAATYVFSGYSNLIIFNRVLKGKIKIWNFVLIFFLGVFNLFTTFFIPIGFHGADSAQEYLYPWITTADSLRLVYSPIERVIFLFLMFYMSITLVSIALHWHVAYELIKGAFIEKISQKTNWIIIALIIFFTIAGLLFIHTVMLNQITVYGLIIRMFFEIIAVSITFVWARRQLA